MILAILVAIQVLAMASSGADPGAGMPATLSHIRMNKELRAQLRRPPTEAPAFLIAAGNWLIRRRRLTAGSTVHRLHRKQRTGWEDDVSPEGGENAVISQCAKLEAISSACHRRTSAAFEIIRSHLLHPGLGTARMGRGIKDYGKPGTPINLVIGYQPYYTESWSGVIMRGKKFYEKYLPAGSQVDFQIGLQGAIIVNGMLAARSMSVTSATCPALFHQPRRCSRHPHGFGAGPRIRPMQRVSRAQ